MSVQALIVLAEALESIKGETRGNHLCPNREAAHFPWISVGWNCMSSNYDQF